MMLQKLIPNLDLKLELVALRMGVPVVYVRIVSVL